MKTLTAEERAIDEEISSLESRVAGLELEYQERGLPCPPFQGGQPVPAMASPAARSTDRESTQVATEVQTPEQQEEPEEVEAQEEDRVSMQVDAVVDAEEPVAPPQESVGSVWNNFSAPLLNNSWSDQMDESDPIDTAPGQSTEPTASTAPAGSNFQTRTSRPAQRVCEDHWIRGNCRYGTRCRYSHHWNPRIMHTQRFKDADVENRLPDWTRDEMRLRVLRSSRRRSGGITVTGPCWVVIRSLDITPEFLLEGLAKEQRRSRSRPGVGAQLRGQVWLGTRFST